jgi:antirestriction protein ArdC
MDVYSVITERIIEKLEVGTIPWHKPWRSIGAPRNLVSKKPYRGVNVWLLTAQGYTSPYWATMRQINELGGQVRKGEKATPVVRAIARVRRARCSPRYMAGSPKDLEPLT